MMTVLAKETKNVCCKREDFFVCHISSKYLEWWQPSHSGKRTVQYKAGGRDNRKRGKKRKDYVSSGARLTNPGAGLSLDYLF